MKPVFDLDAKVEVPSCMYTLPVIQSSNTIAGVGGGGGGSVSAGVVEALEARQDAILARLEALKTEVAAYKKCLGLTVAEAVETSQVRIQLTTAAPNITVPLCFSVFFPRHL